MRAGRVEDRGFGGRKVWFWRVGPRNGKLFHVEQLEIARNDAGLRRFLTVKNTEETVRFYGAADGIYGVFSP